MLSLGIEGCTIEIFLNYLIKELDFVNGKCVNL